MAILNYCHTISEAKWSKSGWNTSSGQMVYGTKVYHPGEHKVGLALNVVSDGSKDGRWLLEQVISLLEYREDDDPSVAGDIVLVTPLLIRTVVDQHYVMCSLEEKEALLRLFTEAGEYWVMCDYAHDEGNDDDVLLGRLSEDGGLRGFAVCWTEGRVNKKTEPTEKGI